MDKPKNKTKRCPKGERRNPKTGLCEKVGEKENSEKPEKTEKTEKPEKSEKPCPPGKILNPKTNRCINIPKEKKKTPSNNKTVKKMGVEKREPEKTEEPKKPEKIVRKKNTTKMSIKETKMFETRKKCIQDFREKLPKISLKNVE